MSLFKPGKFNIIIDGQFGSTGKGLYAGYSAETNKETIHLATTNAAPNAGHTYIRPDGLKIVAKHLPIVGIVTGCPMYLNAGALINPCILREEVENFNIDPLKISIHPHAAVIHAWHSHSERSNGHPATKIGSTQSGVGEAMVDRVRRRPEAVAERHPYLKQFVRKININQLCEEGKTIVCEVPQGISLGLTNSGFYPNTTSRNVSVPQAMADADVHPAHLGLVHMTLRTFPIRVGSIYDYEGGRIGHSGPFFPDSNEMSWEQMDQTPERTTVTKRIRRIASFSHIQFEDSVSTVRPDFIFLNFMNYFKNCDIAFSFWKSLYDKCNPNIQWRLGFGPRSEDIVSPQQTERGESWLGCENFNRIYDDKGGIRRAS